MEITRVCERVNGHKELVSCGICTAFIPREQLLGGLLPEETHHDEQALTKFFMEERERRQELLEAYKLELAMQRSGGVRKKPAAAKKTIMKKPAAWPARSVMSVGQNHKQQQKSRSGIRKKPATTNRAGKNKVSAHKVCA